MPVGISFFRKLVYLTLVYRTEGRETKSIDLLRGFHGFLRCLRNRQQLVAARCDHRGGGRALRWRRCRRRGDRRCRARLVLRVRFAVLLSSSDHFQVRAHFRFQRIDRWFFAPVRVAGIGFTGGKRVHGREEKIDDLVQVFVPEREARRSRQREQRVDRQRTRSTGLPITSREQRHHVD